MSDVDQLQKDFMDYVELCMGTLDKCAEDSGLEKLPKEILEVISTGAAFVVSGLVTTGTFENSLKMQKLLVIVMENLYRAGYKAGSEAIQARAKGSG